ncbi:MAG: DOMON-like domain-containing protein, partial [Cyanobacteria bacterium P01_G01_bin.19]
MLSVVRKSSFDLVNFNSNVAPKIKISGDVSRLNNQLKIKYILTGELAEIIIPQANKSCDRRYDLWEHTCFEFFVRSKNSKKYWEFNLSPSGNWNVFYFLDYRLNIAEEQAFKSFPFEITQNPESLTVEAIVDLEKIDIGDRKLDLAITAVIEDKTEKLSYWALTHPAT